MMDQLYLKTLQVESLSRHNFGKFYTITEMENASKNLAEIEVLQLIRKVISEDIRSEVQAPQAHSTNEFQEIIDYHKS